MWQSYLFILDVLLLWCTSRFTSGPTEYTRYIFRALTLLRIFLAYDNAMHTMFYLLYYRRWFLYASMHPTPSGFSTTETTFHATNQYVAHRSDTLPTSTMNGWEHLSRLALEDVSLLYSPNSSPKSSHFLICHSSIDPCTSTSIIPCKLSIRSRRTSQRWGRW